MKIYVATSWRNKYQPEIVKNLRRRCFQVYDFRSGGSGWNESDGEGGFSWSSIDECWQLWTPGKYCKSLEHPLADAGFKRDMDALEECDCCLYVMPCGPSASMEMGWAKGAGKLTLVYVPELREPDLMVKMADHVTHSWESILLWLNVPLEV